MIFIFPRAETARRCIQSAAAISNRKISGPLLPSAAAVDIDADDFGNFLLQGRADLYVVPDMGWGDTVRVVNGKGTGEAFENTPQHCPRGPERGVVLAEVLRRWTELIKDGT